MAEERLDGRGFFSRWSQRKVAVAKGEVVAEPVVAAVAAPLPVVVVAADPTSSIQPTSQPAPQPALQPTPVIEAPPLTLDDVKLLTGESDFAPFVSRGVAPEVKNAAMKKLFTDPHYNVMDRLDIYIDDYSQPDPLPESMLRQMVSAQFLKLFQEDAENPSPPELSDASTLAAPSAAAPTIASPTPVSDPTSTSTATPDADFNLRLQPDHAPQPPSAGGGAA